MLTFVLDKDTYAAFVEVERKHSNSSSVATERTNFSELRRRSGLHLLIFPDNADTNSFQTWSLTYGIRIALMITFSFKTWNISSSDWLLKMWWKGEKITHSVR